MICVNEQGLRKQALFVNDILVKNDFIQSRNAV